MKETVSERGLRIDGYQFGNLSKDSPNFEIDSLKAPSLR